MAHVGERLRRKEDEPLIKGQGRYVADYEPAGTLHAAILRAPVAHAQLRQVNIAAALAMDGLITVLTSADLPTGLKPIPLRLTGYPDMEHCLQYPLVRDRIRYVGEPLAVVVATSRYVAEDALDLIRVDYEPLPVVASVEAGLAEDAVVLHPSLGHNRAAEFCQQRGDVDHAFASAEVVVEATFTTNRHTAVPLETRGLLADYDQARGTLKVIGPTKVPHFNRMVLSALLELPEHRIHFVEPDVGGGFGARGEFYPEDFLIPFLAMRLGVPVKWVEDRREHLLAINHSRQQTHHVKVAVQSDGTIMGLQDRIYNDHGAYVRTHGATVPEIGAALLPGPYKIPHFRADVVCVMTNKTPTGTYRAPGRFEGTFVRERLLDMVAGRLDLDPAEVRYRNLIQPEDMPYDVGTKGLATATIYDSGDYPGLLRKALGAVNYEDVRRQQLEAREVGRYIGLGIGCFVEKSGLGPWEYARVEIDTWGKAVLYSGASNVGQGVVTVLAQILADELSLSPADVGVVYGDTQQVPFGVGAFASRVTVVGGTAAFLAAGKVRDKALQLAGYLLGAAVYDLKLEDGRVRVKGVPDRSLTLGELARAAQPGCPLPPGMEPGLSASHIYETQHMTYPGGAHACVVEVDVETGIVQLLDYAIAYDIGRAVNPMLVEGQLQGGLAQGVGGTLLEELAYDENGQLLTTTFMDYLLPTAGEVPGAKLFLVEDTPSPLNPLGVKGSGEGGTSGAGGALANAIADALSPFDVEVTSLPLSPNEIFRLLREQADEKPGVDTKGTDTAP